MSDMIWLASTSPRRKKLLAKLLGRKFRIIKPDYDESCLSIKDPKGFVLKAAHNKLLSVLNKVKNGIVISADTIVVLKGKILGKPYNEANSRKMLRDISGKNVYVFTSICVADAGSKKIVKKYEKSKVSIKKLSSEQIESYIRTKEPFDKAGAFAVQGKGSFLVENVEGDYDNVVGLPLKLLSKILKGFGVNVA